MNKKLSIEVQDLIRQCTVEEFNRMAEKYFSKLENWDYHLAKPFAQINEVPDLLIGFSNIIAGLRLVPGMRVLDFGAGSCWLSRFLVQLGIEVIALDVSESALSIGKKLFETLPVIGDHIQPEFLLFDGRRIELADFSVDRIICYDSFHHIPNQEEVLREFYRVLKDGGMAGFSEPGPEHSKSPQAQSTMRDHDVLENDIVIRDIWNIAKNIGFNNIELSVFYTGSHRLSIDDYERIVRKDLEVTKCYMHCLSEFLRNRALFFLYKGKSPLNDSRYSSGLRANLNVNLSEKKIKKKDNIKGQGVVKNVGEILWLPSGGERGSVNFGVHLYDINYNLVEYDYYRIPLPSKSPDGIYPGETVYFNIEIPAPPEGSYHMVFDLVSEQVGWFVNNGSKEVEININIL